MDEQARPTLQQFAEMPNSEVVYNAIHNKSWRQTYCDEAARRQARGELDLRRLNPEFALPVHYEPRPSIIALSDRILIPSKAKCVIPLTDLATQLFHSDWDRSDPRHLMTSKPEEIDRFLRDFMKRDQYYCDLSDPAQRLWQTITSSYHEWWELHQERSAPGVADR